MIYFLTGSDDSKKYLELEKIKKNYKDFDIIFFDNLNFTKEVFEQEFFGSSLFENKNRFFVLKDLYENLEQVNYFDTLLSEEKLVSDAVFLTSKKNIEEREGAKIFLFDNKTPAPDFGLWRALQNRNKKEVWISYIKKLETDSIQSIHGAVISQIKNIYKIYLAEEGDGFKDLGFSTESTYKNALSAAKMYKKEELHEMLCILTNMPKDAYTGNVSFEILLEKFLLEKI